jgi:hypothetical protein
MRAVVGAVGGDRLLRAARLAAPLRGGDVGGEQLGEQAGEVVAVGVQVGHLILR